MCKKIGIKQTWQVCIWHENQIKSSKLSKISSVFRTLIRPSIYNGQVQGKRQGVAVVKRPEQTSKQTKTFSHQTLFKQCFQKQLRNTLEDKNKG